MTKGLTSGLTFGSSSWASFSTFVVVVANVVGIMTARTGRFTSTSGTGSTSLGVAVFSFRQVWALHTSWRRLLQNGTATRARTTTTGNRALAPLGPSRNFTVLNGTFNSAWWASVGTWEVTHTAVILQMLARTVGTTPAFVTLGDAWIVVARLSFRQSRASSTTVSWLNGDGARAGLRTTSTRSRALAPSRPSRNFTVDRTA